MNIRVKNLLSPFVILVLLASPALWYSLNTPYALVDDLTDWRNIYLFDNKAFFIKFLWHNFLELSPGARFRPFTELSQAIFWNIAGTRYGLHHMLRLSLKVGSILLMFFTLKNLSQFLKVDKFYKNITQPIIWGVIFCFTFFPNCPEARLTPQELNVCFFQCFFYYSISTALKDGGLHSKSTYLIMLFSLFGISISKETAVGIVVANVLGVLILFSDSIKCNFKKITSFLVVMSFMLFKVGYAARTGVERQPDLALIKFFINWNDLSRYSGFNDLKMIVFLPLVLLFAFGLRLKHLKTFTSSEKKLLVFFLFQFLLCSLVLLQLNGIFLRYAHPLFPVNIFGTGLILFILTNCLSKIMISEQQQKFFRLGIITCFSWFTLGHYHNFIYQFAAQHRARNADYHLLTRLEQLVGPNGTMTVFGSDETASKIQTYFNEYLPYFYVQKTKGILFRSTEVTGVDLKDTVFAFSEKDGAPKGFVHFERINNPCSYRLLTFVNKLSRLMRYPRRTERWDDSGSPSIEYWAWWDIYKKNI